LVNYIALSQELRQNISQKDFQNVANKYGLDINKKYVLSFGAVDPRKNVLFTIECFFDFVKKNNIQDLYFLICGNCADSMKRKIDEINNDVKKYIKFIGYVDDEDVEILYSNSLFFSYNTLYEGFGMTPLEAMSCGVPVITSNNSSVPEVVGDAAITCSPTDKQAIIKAMEDLYFNEDLREKMSKKGIERAKLFNWNKTCKVIADKIIEDFRG
jgi:glycosyltransferase involved in cell wall biosynthesis